MKIELKNIAVSVAHLLEAGITKTDRLSMLAYIASRDVGVNTAEVGRAFNVSRAKIYGAMVACEQHNLTRQEIRYEIKGGATKKGGASGATKKVGYWYVTPYAKDVLSNFSSSLQINLKPLSDANNK
jgi:hypothetical protein